LPDAPRNPRAPPRAQRPEQSPRGLPAFFPKQRRLVACLRASACADKPPLNPSFNLPFNLPFNLYFFSFNLCKNQHTAAAVSFFSAAKFSLKFSHAGSDGVPALVPKWHGRPAHVRRIGK
jgi:hypothetical protein